MSFCRRSARIRSDRSACVVSLESVCVCCGGAFVSWVCVCFLSRVSAGSICFLHNMLPVTSHARNEHATNRCIILHECLVYVHVFLCLHLTVVFILTLKQMQVSQPLTYSDLGVYNKISDFGILANASTV